MKKLLTFFLTALLAFSVGWAEDMTYTWSSWQQGSLANAPSGVSASFVTTYNGYNNQGVQLTSGTSLTLTISGFTSSYKLTGITIRYATNKSSGRANVTGYLGNNQVASATIAYSSGDGRVLTNATMTVTETEFDGNDLVLTVNATTNSVYVNSFTVSYEETGSTPPVQENWYRKVTSANDLVADKSYIIVNEANGVGMGELNTARYGVAVTDLTFDNNRVNIGGTDVMEMTLGGNSTAWTFQMPNGNYLSDANGNNNVFFSSGSVGTSATDITKWTISVSSSACSIQSKYANSQYIKYNATSSVFGTYEYSQSAIALYMKVEGTTEDPTFSYASTNFYGSQDVTISSGTTGAIIYYTLDGSDPTTESASIANDGTVTINSSCTLKAIAVAPGYDASEVVEATFTKETLPMPTFSPVGGTYDIGTTVTVNINAVDGAAIYYTLDGTDPVATRAAYNGPFTISENTTVKAIAVLNGETSEVATAEYVFAAPSPTCPAMIVFDNTATTALPGTGYHVSAGSDYVTASIASTTYEEAQGIRIGSGSNTGSLTLTLSSDVNKVKKVVINAMRYGSDEGVVVNVTTSNGETKSASIADVSSFADYTFDNFNGNPVTTITISNSATRKRVYIKSVTIYYECAPVATLMATPNPLNINDTNEAGGKTGTIYVSGNNLGGDNVGVDAYDPNHSTNFSSNPGFISHNGTVTDYPVAITYTGQALSATGIVYPANNIVSTSVNINYLYTGPIYVIGDVNNTYWDNNNGVQMTRDENGVYSTTVSVQQSDGTVGYFTFSKQLGSNYTDGQFGPVSVGNWWFNDDLNDIYQPIDTLGNKHNIRILPGIYTITVNPATNEFKIKRYVINVTIDPADGTTFTGSTISGTITDSPAGTIEWSTDGTNWQHYTDGFTATAANVGDQVTIYARSTSNGVTSDVVSATYTRVAAPAPEAPSFSISSSAVAAGTVITITAPEGCTLYVNGQQVTNPYDVTINSHTTISAYCVNDEGTQSTTVTNEYTIAAVCNAIIEFKDSDSDSTTATSWSAIGGTGDSDYFVAGKNYLDGASGISHVFKGKTGLKYGNSSNGGTITFSLDDDTEWKVSHITLNAKNYNDNTVTFTVSTDNGQSETTSAIGSNLGGYTLDFNGSAITSITISASARAYLKGFTITYDCAPVVEAPVITPATGTYYENQTVTITAQEGATIYYTTNGSEPTTSSAVYSGPFTAAYTAGSTTTIKAIAVDEDDNVSEVATATYTWATPSVIIHPDSRNTTATFINVTLTSEPANGTIYYTTDGSTPSATNGTAYNGGFTVDIPNVGDAVTVKAVTVVNGLTSPVATATYTHVETALDVNAPFFSPLQNRTYYGDQTLQIASTTPNADIYYEIVEVSGTTAPSASSVEDPTHMSTYYDGTPIEMTAGNSYYVKAIAYIGNYVSTISEGWYTIKSTDEFEGESGVTYVANIAEFNALGETTATVGFMNPVQVVFMSTYQNDGETAEFCYIRDNSDYGCVYFGKNNTTYHRTIFKMGDWIDGTQVRGLVNVWENNFHNQMGSSNHSAIKSWPSTRLDWSEIIPETTTTSSIASGTAEGDNLWGHYVHLRYTSMSDVAADNDGKYKGSIVDETGANTYYDKFYRWSGLSTSLGNYNQAFFNGKAADGATFDVYGIVDYYKPDSKPFQVCPIDFLWVFKPQISLASGTYHNTQTVSITAEHPDWAAEGVVIYYKTDDMEEWAVYTGPITVNSDTHLQAYAEVLAEKTDGTNYNDYVRSEVVEATYDFEGVEDPSINPESQIIEVVDGTENVDVTVQTNPNSGTGTVTLYTTDGSDPRTSETAIELTSENGTFNLTETTTVNAVSYLTVDGNTIWSNVVTRTYEFIEDNGKTYNLLTTNPKVGSIYVIVNKAANVGLSTTQNATNRAATGVVFDDDATKTIVKGNTTLAEFMLESATAGRYYFRQVGTQNYLTVTTNEYANLMSGAASTDAEATATVNTTVTSGVDQSYPATIAFSYEGNNRYLRYYAGGRVFTTYSDATNQSDIFLYGQEAPQALDPSIAPQSQIVGTESLTVTVTPNDQNPDGAVTYYTTDGSDPRTSSTRLLWTSENGEFDVTTTTTVKAVTGIEFGDTYVWSNVVSETYIFIEPTTLAWIEDNGEVNTDYVVADELVGTWAVKDGNTRLLWAKDQGNRSNKILPGKTDSQKDYVKDILKYEWQETWDESNWVILDFSNLDNDPTSNTSDPETFVGHKISAKSIIGEYTDAVNFTIKLKEKPSLSNDNPIVKDMEGYAGYTGPFPTDKLGTNYDLAYNSYVPANFMTENHNRLENGQVVGGFVADETALNGLEGDSLYFVNPKIQEVAHIWAVWNGGDDETGTFTVYQAETVDNKNINAWNLNGTFNVKWNYNRLTANYDYGRPTDLVVNMAYEFHAAIQQFTGTRLTAVEPQGTANPGTPSRNYMLYPLDMSNAGTPTAVIELIGSRTVVGVTYYNLMGQESKRPFEGINIEVTRYSDGSSMSRKVLR